MEPWKFSIEVKREGGGELKISLKCALSAPCWWEGSRAGLGCGVCANYLLSHLWSILAQRLLKVETPSKFYFPVIIFWLSKNNKLRKKLWEIHKTCWIRVIFLHTRFTKMDRLLAVCIGTWNRSRYIQNLIFPSVPSFTQAVPNITLMLFFVFCA